MDSAMSSSWTMDSGSVRDPPDEDQLLEAKIAAKTADVA